MSASAILFYGISAFILGMGLLAVTSTKIFRSAIWLLLSLVGTAGLYFWMQVEFIAAVQILVYAGGIVVLIIFSIFLTQDSGTSMQAPSGRRIAFSLLAAGFGFAFSYNLISNHGFSQLPAKPFNLTVTDIGMQMLDTTAHGYLLPFEVVSMLLLAAMIGCIVIAMKTAATNDTTTKPHLVKTGPETGNPVQKVPQDTPPLTIKEMIHE